MTLQISCLNYTPLWKKEEETQDMRHGGGCEWLEVFHILHDMSFLLNESNDRVNFDKYTVHV